MKIAQFIQTDKKKKTNLSFQKELWDRIWSKSSFLDLVNQLFKNPIYFRLKKLIEKDDRILEAGCGFGQWVFSLSSQGYKIIGVDIAEETIEEVKKMFPKLDVRVTDVRNLPFKDESFDVYLSFGVIEHFKEGPQKVLLEATRVLKKNGLLFLTLPYLNFFRLLRFGFFSKSSGQFYQYLYSKDEIIKHIKKAGFKVSKVTHYDFINAVKKDFPFIPKIFPKLKNTNYETKKYKNQSTLSLKDKKEPNFLLQKFLYKLDSYIILIEANKL